MSPRTGLLAVLCTALATASILAAPPQTLTYADLVNRMMDLERLAVLPDQEESCRQWSSWDRRSRYDAETGKYVDWAANNDGPNFIRTEGDTVVMAEMEGPGCIWRIWSAAAAAGHVKIFLDDAETPAVDLPFKNYFDGKTAPFAFPTLSYDLQDVGCRGQNLYYPIPYQRSCKIVAEKGWGRYYHVGYTTYSAGTHVPTFSVALAKQNSAALERIDEFFAHSMGTDPAGSRPGEEVVRRTVHLNAGESASFALPGPRAITAIRGRMDLGDREDQMAAMRNIVLQITWDDQKQPAVWCPIGDLCGTAPGVNPYKSLATGMTEDSGYVYWYMPFAKNASIEIINEDRVPRELECEIVHAPLSRPFDELGYFHCKWHRDTVQLPEDRWPDWSLLTTQGRGRFCGVMLHVWNPRGGWWGEGDEKFFVNGEKFPSTFGTGSEDYFGYAWSNPGLFQQAYHCQTMTSGNHGHQSVLRWQVSDNIPFQTSFEACIEKYYRLEDKGTQYACVVCWYLSPDGVDPYAAVAVEKRTGYYIRPPLVAGGFHIVNEPRGMVRTQGMRHFEGKWTNGDHLWWTNAKPGDTLSVAVPVAKTGKQKLSVVLTKARDYGIVQLQWDGKDIGEPIDLYHPTVVPTDPILLGTVKATQGDHTLTIKIVGANEKAVQSFMVGLDQVLLTPAD